MIANSSTLRTLFTRSIQHVIPSSPSSVRERVIRYYGHVKQGIIDEIKKCKKSNQKFSISLDEWTSGANRRYLNVNLHLSNRFWNLGLLRITGACTAEVCLQMIKCKLEEFGLDFTMDIFSLVTDGAAVMTKLGRISEKQQQLCMAHGIHLAVTDVLYRKRTIMPTVEDEDTDSNIDENEVSLSDDEEGLHTYFQDASNEEIDFQQNIRGIISNVRKIVKMFKSSPKKTEVLQNYIGTDSSLILDTKTRWNSLLAMVDRFVTHNEAIQKALIDLHQPPLDNDDLHVLEDIVRVLKPVKLAAEAICRRDANLISADIALSFMMDSLFQIDTDMGREIYHAMKQRILERRSFLSEVARYLHYGNDDQITAHRKGYFSKISRTNLINTIKKCIDSYGQTCAEESQSIADSENIVDDTSACPVQQSMEFQLNNAIAEAMKFKPAQVIAGSSRDQNSLLKKEMSAFQSGGLQGNILKSINSMIMSVPPSSVEAERVFSSANNFCRKTRSKLGDKALNALVVLKSFFLSKQNHS